MSGRRHRSWHASRREGKREGRNGLLERAALGASFICLVHCLALPIAIAALPALGSLLPSDTNFHLGMLAFAVLASGYTLTSGQAQHGRSAPLLTGLFGLFGLVIGVLAFGGTWLETAFTVAGALLLAAAHIANLRLRRPEHRHRHEAKRVEACQAWKDRPMVMADPGVVETENA